MRQYALPDNLLPKAGSAIDYNALPPTLTAGREPNRGFEGLAIGPRLADGRYLILAGTDNDYSVTQNGSATRFDVWFRMADADPYAGSIQCPVGTTADCVFTTGGAAATLTGDYTLLPGVLHAYTADIAGYTAPVPEPTSLAMMLAGIAGVAAASRRRRSPQGA